MDRDAKPILLRMVDVMVGRKRMFLLTNELALTCQQLSEIYAARWGIEVTFRMVKQNLERAKLQSRTPENVIIELDWTMLAIWYGLHVARECIPPDGKLSGIKVFRVFMKLILHVATHSVLTWDVCAALSRSTVADESGRVSGKNSHNYPRKKRTNRPESQRFANSRRSHGNTPYRYSIENRYQRWVAPISDFTLPNAIPGVRF
jgi:hypothetical protein